MVNFTVGFHVRVCVQTKANTFALQQRGTWMNMELVFTVKPGDKMCQNLMGHKKGKI